jgi:hypothetical protein
LDVVGECKVAGDSERSIGQAAVKKGKRLGYRPKKAMIPVTPKKIRFTG